MKWSVGWVKSQYYFIPSEFPEIGFLKHPVKGIHLH